MIYAILKDLVLLYNKARFIKEVLDNTIDLRKKRREQITELFKTKQYDVLDEDEDYKYLTKMPMDSVTEENVDKLLKEHGSKNIELETIKSLTIQQMWLNELDNLQKEYTNYKEDREKTMRGTIVPKKKTVNIVKKSLQKT